MTARDRTAAQHLAQEGLGFSIILRDENRPYFSNLPYSYFAIAAAISLTWTRHALHTPEYIEYASGYIDGLLPINHGITTTYCYRFGKDDLDNALLNYRRYYSRTRNLMPDFNSADAHRINRLQTRLLGELDQLRIAGIVSGIGPWLFTGPFKIILSDQDRLWEDASINGIVLPTGTEVDRGINKLIREGYSFVQDFDPNWLQQNTSSLLENFATYNMVHSFIADIGHLSNTSAIHINSALYLYGKSEITV